MTESLTTRRPDPAPATGLGPGALVLVVGPSGAGKDTVIGLARAALSGDHGVVFPRRIITRPADPTEDNDAVSPEVFERLVGTGAVALAWQAHGLGYAVPASADDDIAAGRVVVVNVSRRIIAGALAKYARVRVVLVTAPPAVLAERLARRGREAAADILARLDRAGESLPDVPALVVLANVGAPEAAAARLVAVIRELQAETV